MRARGSDQTAYEYSQMLQEYSPATIALREASNHTKSPRAATSKLPELRQTKSAFQLSPRIRSRPPPPSPTLSSSGFFGWTKWYKGLEIEKSVDRDTKEEAEEVVSEEVTNLFKAALQRRKQLQEEQEEEQEANQSTGMTTDSQYDEFAWPQYSIGGGGEGGGSEINTSNRTSLASSYNETNTLPSLDLDDFSSSFEYSPPQSRRRSPRSATLSDSTTSHLRSTQSNVTLKAPQLLRRVSSSASILVVPVELPPQSPHSPQASPTLSCDDFTLSPTLLSYSTTSSLSSESTSRSSSTITSTASVSSSVSSSTSAQSDSSFRSRFSTLRKAASSAALNFFNPREGAPEPVPPLPSATASVLLRDVLLKHDQSTPDSPSPPLSSQAFYYDTPTSPSYTFSDVSDSYDLDSPSSAFPPFDPFTTFDNTASPTSTFPPTPLSPQPRLLARQRSFIDPHTRSLRTAPSLLCTPPTPDKTERDGTGPSGDVSSGGDDSDDVSGGGGRQKGIRSRRKRGKRKSRSTRNLKNQSEA